jgi:hypothetical protein
MLRAPAGVAANKPLLVAVGATLVYSGSFTAHADSLLGVNPTLHNQSNVLNHLTNQSLCHCIADQLDLNMLAQTRSLPEEAAYE